MNVIFILTAIAAAVILILLLPIRFKLRVHLDALRLSGGFCAEVFGMTAYCGVLAIEDGALAFYDRHGIPSYTDISLIPRKRAVRRKRGESARARRGRKDKRADKRGIKHGGKYDKCNGKYDAECADKYNTKGVGRCDKRADKYNAKCADRCAGHGGGTRERESLPSFLLRHISLKSVRFSSEVGILADPFAACMALSLIRTAVSAALGILSAGKGIAITSSYKAAYDKTEVKFELNGIFFMSVANIILCAATLIYRSKRIGKSPASAIVLSSPFAVRQKR